MDKEMDRNKDLSVLEKVDIALATDRNKEAYKHVDFAIAFRDLSKKLSFAYNLSDDIYSQSASMQRLNEDSSINSDKEFLKYLGYNPKTAENVIGEFANKHKPKRVYLGTDMPLVIGDTVLGSNEILSVSPDKNAHGRLNTIGALAQRAARLNALLEPETGIPEAYATAEGKVRYALEIVEKAAELAYDWDAVNKGSVNVELAIEEAGKRTFGSKIRKASLVGALALAGCQATVTPIVQPDNTPTDPVATETNPNPTNTPDTPAGTSTETPVSPETRTAVTAEMARNVDPSLQIGTGELDENGNLKDPIFPENASKDFQKAVRLFYAGIQNKYPGSKVFFNQDDAPGGTRTWILYATTPEGKLIYSLVQYMSEGGALGEKQYNDNPIHFDPNTGEMLGEYVLLDVPGETIGIIWDHGLPQFLSNEKTAQNGDRYFTEAFNYKTLSPDSPWVEVAGVDQLIPTEVPKISTPTAEQLALGKENLALADIFTFGGHEWTATQNAEGEKIWTREDGKVNLEWVHLYGGGKYNAYMFVSRSEHQEGERSLEIYTDPRYPVFDVITGTPSQIDAFVLSVGDATEGDAAQAALRLPGSTLKLIIGGLEYWPTGDSSSGPQDIYYYGPNGETLSQKIWGYLNIPDSNGETSGQIGPFVEADNKTVQFGWFFNKALFESIKASADTAPDFPLWYIEGLIGQVTSLDPGKKQLDNNYGSEFNDGSITNLRPLFNTELISSN